MAALAALAVEIGVIIRHKEIARVHRASAPSNDFRDDYNTNSILKHGIEHSRFFVPAKLK